MAAADQLIALVTKTAEKLNALNTAIGTKADIGVSSDAGNILENGSDNRPYFDGENIPIGVSGDTNNALILGSDDKPFLEDGLYVPSTRQLSAGTGINTIGDLSANRSITLDFDYLDTRYGSGFKQREAARVATTGNITLSGLQTIDGVVLGSGHRVLVRKQNNAAQNGVYIAASGSWTRATDFDEPEIEEITQGASVFVEEGTLLKGTGWTLQTPPPYVIGTTPLEFIQYAGASSYTGGNLITIDGNQINHDTGSWVAKSNLSGAAVISNLSVDAYGHLTNWTTRNLTAGNIGAEPSFSKNTAFNKNFGTSAGTVAQGNDSRINNGQTAFSWGDHATAGYVSLTASEDIGGVKNFTGSTGRADFTGTAPQLRFVENDGGFDAKNSILIQDSNRFELRLYSDDFSSQTTPFRITRNQTAATEILLNAPTVINNTLSVSSDLTVSNPSRIRFGSIADLYESSGGVLALNLRSSNFNIYDNFATRFSFDRTSGNFTATGTITGSNLSGTNTGDQTLSGLGGEPAFSKNTAFNKNFGTASGTVAQGNDSRINNGQTAYGWGNHASAGYVPTTRTITAGTGLTGGGNLTANRTINVNFGTSAGTVAEGNHTHPASAITSGTFANARISQSSVTQHEAAINAGSVDGKHIWAGTEDNLPSSRNSNTIYFAY